MKKALAFILALTCAVVLAVPMFAAETSTADGTVAHWKFQKLDGCYTGNISKDDLTFIDLTGNGNDLVTVTVGNGDQLSIFDWDEGNTVGASTSTTSLQMNNSKENSASVDTYSSDETSWTGGYTSGKFFETVDGAPINSMAFDGAYTVEVIFKISPEFNNDYNRYVGVFGRQGVVSGQDEAPLVLAVSEVSGATTLAEGGTTCLQYIHVDADGNKKNTEFGSGIEGDQWIHYMVVNDGEGLTEAFINGESVSFFDDGNGVYVTDPSYKWEVGVGRKDGTSHEGVDSMNANEAEGMIRRLFCGSISEIRVSDKALTIEESLYNVAVNYETETTASAEETTAEETAAETVEETVTETVEETVTETVEETVIVPEETTAAAEKAPQTFDASVIAAVSAAVSALGFTLAKKKK